MSNDICPTPEEEEFSIKLSLMCRSAALSVCKARYVADVRGCARFGVHCRDFPIHILVHDRYGNVQFPESVWFDYNEVLLAIRDQMEKAFGHVTVAFRDKRNQIVCLSVQGNQHPPFSIAVTSERQCYVNADRFIGTTIYDYPPAKDFIRELKNWGFRQGIICPDFGIKQPGALPDTAFTMIAASVYLSKKTADFVGFYSILANLGSENKQTFIPDDCTWESHYRRKRPFVHVAYPKLPKINAASTVDPEVWTCESVHEVENALSAAIEVRTPSDDQS